jgi:hypothetical protein
MLSSLTSPSIIFALTLVSGFWLSRSGKPYPGLLFNVHKLIALGTVIFTAMQVRAALIAKDAGLLSIGLLVVASVCAIALFASGAFMSAGKLDQRLMKGIHNLAPVVAVPALIAAIYFLAANTP